MQKVAKAFIEAKKVFGPVVKNKKNPHLKNNYADLEACLDAVQEACLANNIAMYQETFEDQTGVTVETVFLHESGESLRCGKLHVPAQKQDPQGYGSALTYARRYSLITACGVAAEDDDGNASSGIGQKRQDQQNKPTQQAQPKPQQQPKPQPEATSEQEDSAIYLVDAFKSGDKESVLRHWAEQDADSKRVIWHLIAKNEDVREYISSQRTKKD